MEAGAAIEKAEPQNVHIDKPQKRPAGQPKGEFLQRPSARDGGAVKKVRPGETALREGSQALDRFLRGITIMLLDPRGDSLVESVVLKMIPQPAFRAVDQVAEVNGSLERNPFRLKQAHKPGRVEAAVLDPTSPENRLEADAVGYFRPRRIRNDPKNLVPQVGWGNFIGVGVVHPRIFEGQSQGSLAMVPLVIEVSLDDARAGRTGDCNRSVGAERIEDENIVAPFHRFQAGGKIGFFVSRQDENGNHLLGKANNRI